MKKIMLYACLLLAIIGQTAADVYLHNPRGSNNRLDGNNRDRNNANRLFDSQNNARGGYNVGNLYYYVDSNLGIEWTNQHSCQDQNSHCEIVMQYMCSPLLRDGVSENIIPLKPKECAKMDCNADLEYGMQEDFYYYKHCKLRTRNKGLFLSNQNLNNLNAAINTRQNRQGNRYGYECPEERDYYPYWGPTPWKDIAVLTNDVSRCEYYQTESQNVKKRFACEVPYEYLYLTEDANNNYIPINKEKCEGFDVTLQNGTVRAGVWKEYPSHNLQPPVCANNLHSRDNHLGNTLGGNPATFNWTVNDTPNENCVIRIRYNISTAEYDGWNITSKSNNRVQNDGPGPDLWTRFGLSESEGKSREYYLKGNPEVNVFDSTFTLQLAVNTAQFGRTFEDRSHRMAIRSRKENKDAKIHNLNVRGKRGNIVQVYPAVEYDFVPNTLRMATNDFVHIQWTGSNDNPNGNDGQGRQATDRSNIVPQDTKKFAEGNPEMAQKYTFGSAGRSYPSNMSVVFAGLSAETLTRLAVTQFGGVMEELDDAGTYYDLGPKKITMTGDYNYMCTRNNNFSNRSQKGKLVVKDSAVSYAYVGELGGNITVTGTENKEQTGVSVPPGALSSPQMIQIEVYPENEVNLKSKPQNTNYVSDFVMLSDNVNTSADTPFLMTISLKSGSAVGSLYEPTVYRTVDDLSWMSMEIESDKTTSSAVHFKTDSGGYFVVSKSIAAGPMAGLILGCIAAVLLIGGVIFYCRNTKMPLASYSSKV